MKNTTHRVVILNNVNSEIISSAILILKNSEDACESAVLEEAERVVEKYMQKHNRIPAEKEDGKFMVSFLFTAAIVFLGLCAFAVFRIF